MTPKRPIIRTDVYPTRYAAFDAPGSWAVFTPAADDSYRSCREDGPRHPRSVLGAGIKYPGEMAVLSVQEQCADYPDLWGGAYIEIGGSLAQHGFWGTENPATGYCAVCHYTAPTKGRPQRNARIYAPTIDEAMARAEAWIEEQGIAR